MQCLDAFTVLFNNKYVNNSNGFRPGGAVRYKYSLAAKTCLPIKKRRIK